MVPAPITAAALNGLAVRCRRAGRGVWRPRARRRRRSAGRGLRRSSPVREQFRFAADAVVERQRAGGFDRGDAVVRGLLVARAAGDGFAHRVEHGGVGGGLGEFIRAVAHPRQGADGRDLARKAMALSRRIGAVRKHVVEDAECARFRRRDVAAGDDHLHRRPGPISRGRRCVPPPPGRMPISTSGSPTFADGHCDAVVARQRHFQSAAEGVAVDRRDDRFRCWRRARRRRALRAAGACGPCRTRGCRRRR